MPRRSYRRHMKISRFALLAIGLLPFGSVASGDTLKILLAPGETENAKSVRELILPMVSVNPHFTLVSESSWDVKVDVSCVRVSVNDVKQGIACSALYMYAPDYWMGISRPLGMAIFTGPDASNMATRIFGGLLDLSLAN
jgi:hypothetical protein